MRSSRAQKPWIVEIEAPSAERASSRRPSSRKRARTRSLISAAALSVKVIASIPSTGTPSSTTALTKRSTSTVVLPVPAPARTSSGALAPVHRLLLLGGEAHRSHRHSDG